MTESKFKSGPSGQTLSQALHWPSGFWKLAAGRIVMHLEATSIVREIHDIKWKGDNSYKDEKKVEGKDYKGKKIEFEKRNHPKS